MKLRSYELWATFLLDNMNDNTLRLEINDLCVLKNSMARETEKSMIDVKV